MDVAWFQFQKLVLKINSTVETLSQSARNNDSQSAQSLAPSNTPQPLISAHASLEVQRARQSVIADTTQLQQMLRDPADLIQQLAFQTQLLACLQWLGDFQILACIPLNQGVPYEDVAHLAGVPQAQLTRVVRIAASAGFLCEMDLGHIAHTSLSAQFVLKPSLLDAVMFMSETITPTALRMTQATREHGDSQRPDRTAYNIAFKNAPTFAVMCEQRPKLRRQLVAFDRFGTNAGDENVTDLLGPLHWASLGDATVVEVGARSTNTVSALAELFPNLQFVVQVYENGSKDHTTPSSSSRNSVQGISLALPRSSALSATMLMDNETQANPRSTIQRRTPGKPQTTEGAAIYILRAPSPSATSQTYQAVTHLTTELRAHLDILRASPESTLIVVIRILPEPGALDPGVEAITRSRDIMLHQLSNKGELRMQELVRIVNNVKNNAGRLVLVKKLIDQGSPIVALEIRFQALFDRSVDGSTTGFWSP